MSKLNKILKWLSIPAIVVAVGVAGCEEFQHARQWSDCRLSSNWDGPNAEKRMMNLVSPHFSASKVREYLDWQEARGCDHVHLLLVNDANGEGAGYDALVNGGHKAIALRRVRSARLRGLGVVAWIVSDDSDAARKRIFADPSRYAEALADYMPYLSYIVLGLEMDEGAGSMIEWRRLRDAIRKAGWTGPIATHHTSGNYAYAILGSIVMDQRAPSCSAANVARSVTALRARGFEVCGFEYARSPDRAKAQAALDAGAFGCGNW